MANFAVYVSKNRNRASEHLRGCAAPLKRTFDGVNAPEKRTFVLILLDLTKHTTPDAKNTGLLKAESCYLALLHFVMIAVCSRSLTSVGSS
jgi:hypothetical protein